jgi:hypothetical protein
MASIAKWFKRAKAALLSGDMRTWEGTKNMIGSDLRSQLENEFNIGGKAPKIAPVSRREAIKVVAPVVEEPASDVEVAVEVPEAEAAPAASSPRRRRRAKKSTE